MSGSISLDEQPRTRLPVGTGPVSPRVLEKKALRTKQPGAPDPPWDPGPHIPSGPLSGREQTPLLGGPEPPRVRKHARSCQASSGRLAHLPHLIWVVQKCSAAAEPEETFDKLYCWSRVTKVHSTTAGTTYATRVSPLRQLDMTTR